MINQRRVKNTWFMVLGVPKKVGRKTLSSAPTTGTPKLQLFIEQLLMRTTCKPAEKIFHN